MTMNHGEEIALTDLIGKHQLDAVDFLTEREFGGDAQVVRFRLDGVVYIAKEDPDDGYRSSLGSVTIGGSLPMANTFPPAAVTCTHHTEHEDILKFADDETQKVVLEIGTENADDYYPSFVGSFHPEAMASNLALDKTP